MAVLFHVHSVWHTVSFHDNGGKVSIICIISEFMHTDKNFTNANNWFSSSFFFVMRMLNGSLCHRCPPSNSATVAKQLLEDSFALIFGINTLAALTVQSMLTYIAITHLDLYIRVQYYVYGGYFFALATTYSVFYVVGTLIRK